LWDLINTSVYASLLLSVAIAVIGSLIVINKTTAITGSIAHGSFGGIGLALYFGRQDSLIGVIWAVGMSIGIIFLSLTPGYQSDALSYLFGNILLIENKDLIFMGGIDFLIVISIIFLYNRFLACQGYWNNLNFSSFYHSGFNCRKIY